MNARDHNFTEAAASESAQLAERFYGLFRSSDVAHGAVDFLHFGDRKPTKPELRKKTRTLDGPASKDDWRRHLDGKMGLGVAPITSADTCTWGCIDWDEYDTIQVERTHAQLVADVERLKLPLVVCRSKSGGAHLFLFLSAPAPAADLTAALKRARAILELPEKAEIFPKQVSLAKGEKPSWLNMPYYGGEESDRYGVKPNGLGMHISEFVNAAEESRVDPAELASLARVSANERKERPRSAPDRQDVAARLEDWCERLADAPRGGTNNALQSIAFNAGRWVRDTDLKEEQARAALRSVWLEVKRGSADTPAEAEAEFDDVWKRQFSIGQQKGRSAEKGEAGAAVMTCLADVRPRPVEWLWPGRIALGKLSMIAGQPGLGKSQLAVWIAATVTRGGNWPEGEGTAPAGEVILLSAEDNAQDTVRPRFDAAGGDPRRATVLEMIHEKDRLRGFDLGRDVQMLGDVLAQRPDVRLVVIDPISAYLGSVDSHRNTDVRGVLMPLQKLAEEYRVAVLLISHLRKAGGEAINAVQGSGAFVAAVRSAFIVTRETDEAEADDGRMVEVTSDRRILTTAKNNLGPDGADAALAYRIVVRDNGDGISAPAVAWAGRVRMTADEALNPAEKAEKQRKPRDEAKALLRRMLRDGARSQSDIKTAAAEAGLSWRTVETAKSQLDVKSRKDGARWLWYLPGVQEELSI